jgi:hypothetical protein
MRERHDAANRLLKTIVHHGRLDPGTELIAKPLVERVLARKIRQVLDAPAVSKRASG